MSRCCQVKSNFFSSVGGVDLSPYQRCVYDRQRAAEVLMASFSELIGVGSNWKTVGLLMDIFYPL